MKIQLRQDSLLNKLKTTSTYYICLGAMWTHLGTTHIHPSAPGYQVMITSTDNRKELTSWNIGSSLAMDKHQICIFELIGGMELDLMEGLSFHHCDAHLPHHG